MARTLADIDADIRAAHAETSRGIEERRRCTRGSHPSANSPPTSSVKSYANVARIDSEAPWTGVQNKRPPAGKPAHRPTIRGTRSTELHVSLGKNAKTNTLRTQTGNLLMETIIKAVNATATDKELECTKSNPIVSAKWSMRGTLVIQCFSPLDDTMIELLKKAANSLDDDTVTITNRPPTTLLKFTAVPTVNYDGSETDEYDLENDIRSHPAWADVQFVEQPKFITPRGQKKGLTAVVLVSVADNSQGSIGKKLLSTTIHFSCGPRRCLPWIIKNGAKQCTTCMRWGHPAYWCRSQQATCARCGGNHATVSHPAQCTSC